MTCPAKGQTVNVQPPTKTTGRKGDAPPLRSVNVRRNRMDIVLAVSPLEAALWVTFVAIGMVTAVVAMRGKQDRK